MTECRGMLITGEGLTVANKKFDKELLKVDTIVLAVGLISNQALIEDLKEKALEVYAIGDCVEPRLVIDAIWGGFRTARLI